MIWLVRIQSIITQYPELVAWACAAFLSWAPGLVLETWFLPETWPARKMKQVTLSITVGVAFLTSTILWHLLDPTDKNSIVGLVSLITAFSAPVVHVFVAKVITHYFPWVDSCFHFKAQP